MTARRSPKLLGAVGLSLVLGGLLLLIGYTTATLGELRRIEAFFGEMATGAAREEMLPQLLIVDALGVLAVVVGAVLLLAARRRRTGTAGPEVRQVRADEIDDASAVVLDAYRSLLGRELSEEYAAVVADVADRAALAEVLVAVEGERVVGCITYVPGPDSRYAEFSDPAAAGIRMLAVSPTVQGRGVGAALVRDCLERARTAGRRRVVLHSTEPMRAAQRLYEREGFRRAPERDWEPEPGLLLLGYEREL